MLIHVDLMVLSRIKSIASQNQSQSITIHSNSHGIGISEQGINPPQHMWIVVNTRVSKQSRMDVLFLTCHVV